MGHGDEENVWFPKEVSLLKDTKIVRIECCDARTLVITEWGCVMMWGIEPVTSLLYKTPFVYEYLRPYRIYSVKCARDFTIAMGVQNKNEQVTRPNLANEVISFYFFFFFFF